MKLGDITIPLDDYDVEEFAGIAARFGSDRYAFVVTPNVDHLIRYHEDAEFRALCEQAAYTLLDSRFLARLLRLTRGLKLRVCPGSDLTAWLFEKVIAPEDPIILIGATPAQALMLQQRHGLLQLRHFNPPMGFAHDPEAFEACLQFIEAQGAFRFCFLAVGSPQQERVAQHLKLRGQARGLVFCVGASVNFLTGAEHRAPRWVQQAGLEWLFRMLQNPRRLAGRYMVRGPRIFGLLQRMTFGLRRPKRAS